MRPGRSLMPACWAQVMAVPDSRRCRGAASSAPKSRGESQTQPKEEILSPINVIAALALSLFLVPMAHGASDKPAKPVQVGVRAAAQRVDILVTADGFVPAKTKVKVGQPVTLVVTRKVGRTCATDIVIKDYGVNKPLPVNVPVEVMLTPRQAGPIRFACAMDMIGGELIAE